MLVIPATQEAEAGRWRLGCWPELHREFQASLGYIARPPSQKKKIS
jgi:hypothetical protein